MEKAKGKNGYILEMLKALIIALIISLLAVLILAFAITLFDLSDKTAAIITQIIKSLSVFIAALVSFRLPKNGWIRGLIFGILYILLAFVVFSLLYNKFNFELSLLNDVALGAVTGMITGIISVNLIKRKG